jgi:iron complex transport system substrate-binding protein
MKVRLKGITPSAEQIIALKPDLVLIPQDFASADLLQQLDRLNVPAFVLRAASLEDVFEQIQVIARIFERQPSGDLLVSAMRQRIAQVRAEVQSRPRPRVLYVLNSDPLQSAGPGSFIHQLIETAGGINIAADARTAYPRLSLEEVIARNPEFLVFPAGTEEGIPEEEREQWRRWPSLEAVKRNQLVSVPSTLVDRPGPRLVEGLEQLARAIHPELPALSLRENTP